MLAWLLAAMLRIKTAQAQILLATLASNRMKREVIQSCALVTLQSEARIRDVVRVLRRIAKAASKRNFLAHGTAGYHQKYPDAVTFARRAKRLSRPVTLIHHRNTLRFVN
jgi:hypothetical protein